MNKEEKQPINFKEICEKIPLYNSCVVDAYDNSPEGNREVLDNILKATQVKNHFISLYGYNRYSAVLDNMLLTDLFELGGINLDQYNLLLLFTYDRDSGYKQVISKMDPKESKDNIKKLSRMLSTAITIMEKCMYCERAFAMRYSNELFFRLNMLYGTNVSYIDYVKSCSYNNEGVEKVMRDIVNKLYTAKEEADEKEITYLQDSIVNIVQYLVSIGFDMNNIYKCYQDSITESINGAAIRLGKFSVQYGK